MRAFCRVGEVRRIALAVALVAIVSVSAPAQEAPPIPGVTAKLALDGIVEKFYTSLNRALVKTSDGARHLVHLTRRTSVHGTERSAQDAFGGLEEGSHVIVHYDERGAHQ